MGNSHGCLPFESTSITIKAELFRRYANFEYRNSRFPSALSAYTKAIALCPNVSVYWCSRALCYSKTNDWVRVEEDSRRAIQLDNHSIKAHYILSLALLQREEYKEAVKEVEKALELRIGRDASDALVVEIWQRLAKAKYLNWESESTGRLSALNKLQMECKEALRAKFLNDPSSDAMKQNFVGILTIFCGKVVKCINVIIRLAGRYLVGHQEQIFLGPLLADGRFEALDSVFKKAAENDRPFKVPEYLCCKITHKIMRDPVDRVCTLMKDQPSKCDPITRRKICASDMIPNLAIKEAVRLYLDKHGWAYRVD